MEDVEREHLFDLFVSSEYQHESRLVADVSVRSGFSRWSFWPSNEVLREPVISRLEEA